MSFTGYPIDPLSLKNELIRIGVDPRSLPIFRNKSQILLYKVIQIDSRAATLLKQLFLSSGGDVAVNWEVIRFTCDKTDAITLGTMKHYHEVLKKLQEQPFFGLENIAKELDSFIQTYLMEKKLPRIMGILNVTPDSFSDGGQYLSHDLAVEHAEALISEGADILDIGGESSRPGSEQVSEATELHRVLPVLKSIKERFPQIQVSVDTYKPKVAEKAIELGVDIINSIQLNDDMLNLIGYSTVKCVIMHMRGTPKDMQLQTSYPDGILADINHFFETKLREMERFAIDPSRIWLDPGIGFAKTPEQNLMILHHLDTFLGWNQPILLGHSRKSFMKAVYNLPVENRVVCTALYSYLALLKGVDILRVHDVAETKLALQIYRNQLSDA